MDKKQVNVKRITSKHSDLLYKSIYQRKSKNVLNSVIKTEQLDKNQDWKHTCKKNKLKFKFIHIL